MAGRGLLNSPPFPGGLLAPQSSGLLGGMPTFATMYPEVVAGQTLPTYRPSEEQRAAMLREVLPDLAPVQIIKSMVSGIGGLAMQANAAMPWAGGDPTAVGLYPDGMAPEHYPAATAGGMDPSVMIPFATDVAGMATTGSLAAPAVRNATGMGIRAYHGSPHDFDRFSMDKIGTGEGAQAYGHGLYFAENEGVAQGYKRDTTKFVNAADPIAREAQDWLDQFSTPAEARAEIDDMIAAIRKRGDEATAQRYEAIRGYLDNPRTGRMYEVDIDASPDEFLDWDKPLSEQPAKVREAVRASYGDIRPVRLKDGSYSVTRVRPDGSGDTIWDVKATTADEALAQFDDWLAAASGRDVYQHVARGLDITPGSQQGAATDNFRAAGIKGIRYQDAGSRYDPADLQRQIAELEEDLGFARRKTAPDPVAIGNLERMIGDLKKKASQPQTSNYVVFDDKNINILKKYGIAGLMAGGAGAAALGSGTQDASAAPASYSTGGRF